MRAAARAPAGRRHPSAPPSDVSQPEPNEGAGRDAPRVTVTRRGEGPRPHHAAGGRFRSPPPMEQAGAHGRLDLLRWQWERVTRGTPPDPKPGDLPAAVPDVARPRAAADALRVTWVGHSTFLLQVGGLNVLTDPVWSLRASPVQWAGPRRFVPPGIAWDDLPEIDLVLLSHDHYDHLDEHTVARLAARFGPGLPWIAPLGYARLLAGWGARAATELDWDDEARVETAHGALRVACLPAQHWTRRALREMNDRLWASYALESDAGRRLYFAGDSGYWGGYGDIGRRFGPFDAALVPIGAYEPRSFMRRSHMNAEEAVRAFADLGGTGTMVAMHWGTFRLTDEDPLEPPVRARAAWSAAGLPPGRLAVLRHGETVDVPALSKVDAENGAA
jgi:N-acyl-phosphatidylethanolamine-hydrolysing phospholipase D